MNDRTDKAVDEIMNAALAAAPQRSLGELAQADADDLRAVLAGLLELPPGIHDLGGFDIPGGKPTDLLIARRIRIAGRVFRVVAWPEQ